jgi:hypothetical protein
MIAGLGLLFFLQACHDDGPCFPGCPPKPSCQAQSHLTHKRPEAVKPEPHQFIKTFGADGKVDYMDAYPTSLWGVLRFKGFIRYAGNQVFMLDSLSRDTILRVQLDGCDRPLFSYTLVSEGNLQGDRYEYDRKGRLSAVINFRPGTADSGRINWQYDQHNNVISIGNPDGGLKYEYDYSKPTKGAYYETGVFNFPTFGPRLLEFLGYLDTQPNHLLVKFTNNYEYPYQIIRFKNQILNGQGYLASYDAYESSRDEPGAPDPELPPAPAFNATLNWYCGGGHKY